jgi:hypothetical protein
MGRRCTPRRMESRCTTEHRRWPCRTSGRTFHIPVSKSGDRPILENHWTRAHGYSLLLWVKEKNNWIRATFIPRIPGFSSSSTMKAQSRRGAFPRHRGQDRMRSRRIPRRPHSSLGAKKDAMAEWNTEILPSITGQSLSSMSADVISAFSLTWSKRKQRATSGKSRKNLIVLISLFNW